MVAVLFSRLKVQEAGIGVDQHHDLLLDKSIQTIIKSTRRLC